MSHLLGKANSGAVQGSKQSRALHRVVVRGVGGLIKGPPQTSEVVGWRHVVTLKSLCVVAKVLEPFPRLPIEAEYVLLGDLGSKSAMESITLERGFVGVPCRHHVIIDPWELPWLCCQALALVKRHGGDRSLAWR